MSFEVYNESKDFYTFAEVISITSIKPYVLRFWESEFEQINSKVLDDGSKVYSENSLSSIKIIKDLLFSQKMSIPKAKIFLDKKVGAEDISTLDEKKVSLKERLGTSMQEQDNVFFVQPPMISQISGNKNIDLRKIVSVRMRLQSTLEKLSDLEVQLNL
ncbi:MAG: MerR family transcriptional regulator [Bacteriovoracaceae bacterium]|jgi:DNA-binding transcriptional MerR regulator|nr:MerR family transcriptional regulator [Bacteriovoracaceae bacterium]